MRTSLPPSSEVSMTSAPVIRDVTAAEGHQTDEQADGTGHLPAALLLHDQKLGHTGNEDSQCHRRDCQLAGIHQPLFLQIIQAGSPVVAAEEAEDEGHRGFLGEADGCHDRRHPPHYNFEKMGDLA